MGEVTECVIVGRDLYSLHVRGMNEPSDLSGSLPTPFNSTQLTVSYRSRWAPLNHHIQKCNIYTILPHSEMEHI